MDADGVSREVAAFYERHPYPPAVGDLEQYRQRWTLERRRATVHLLWPDAPYRDDRNILVAGCGTSQAAKYALRWPRAQVTGIDVSATSIANTAMLKRKYHLDNLALHQLPVERVGELERRFDHVVCTGVLHHLPDPDRGLAALHSVLADDGALEVMVYAPYGRAGVYLLQDYCRRLGIGTSAREIRDLAHSLLALPPDHPLVPLLRSAPDFRSEAGLADALLHPHDRAYSVPQLLSFLSAAGLRFGRWSQQAPYLACCGGLSSTPHNALLTRLPLDEQFAAVELFRGTMAMHSAVAYHSEQGRPYPIHFEGDAWLAFVPIRRPDTIVVTEKLPANAAFVLINRKHSYSDLYLPIDLQEKTLFDAIDGKRTIGEIARRTGHHDGARSLFERLWWYDQVVFDVSSASAR